MKIETKYNIDQEVYRMENNKVKELIIEGITIRVSINMYHCKEIQILYKFETRTSDSTTLAYNEEDIFGYKQELLDSL